MAQCQNPEMAPARPARPFGLRGFQACSLTCSWAAEWGAHSSLAHVTPEHLLMGLGRRERTPDCRGVGGGLGVHRERTVDFPVQRKEAGRDRSATRARFLGRGRWPPVRRAC